MKITTDEKNWLDSLAAICEEHLDYCADKDLEIEDEGVSNLCNGLLFTYGHLSFTEVQRPTLH
jgi:hypothetical protein